MGTTSTGTKQSTGRKRPRPTPRILALAPFASESDRDEVREFESVLMYGVQELMGLLGKVQVIDLAPWGALSNESKGRSSGVPQIRELLKESGGRAVLTGSIEAAVGEENPSVQSLDVRIELLQFEPRRVEKTRFDFFVRNLAADEVCPRFDFDMSDLMKIHRQIFLGVKKKLGWRYCGGPDRRRYYDYRLKNPMTRSFQAYRNFVRARRLSRSRDEKLSNYKKAAHHDPCMGQAYRNIGYLYKESKKLRTAANYYQGAIQNLIDSHTLADAYAELGLCHANMNEVDEAIRYWHRSKRWNARNKDVYANLAIGYEEKGMVDRAIRYFTRAQRIDPDYYWACRGLGRIYAGRQDWENAIEQLATQLRIAPEDAWGHYTLGNCYFHVGRATKARSHCRRAVELDPHGDAGRRAFQLLMEIDES